MKCYYCHKYNTELNEGQIINNLYYLYWRPSTGHIFCYLFQVYLTILNQDTWNVETIKLGSSRNMWLCIYFWLCGHSCMRPARYVLPFVSKLMLKILNFTFTNYSSRIWCYFEHIIWIIIFCLLHCINGHFVSSLTYDNVYISLLNTTAISIHQW